VKRFSGRVRGSVVQKAENHSPLSSGASRARLRVALAALLACLFTATARAADAPRLQGEVDAKGLAQAIAREKGKVVLVNFWATWCVPCRKEFPDLVRLQKTYAGKGLAVVGVSTDLSKDLPAVEKFLAETKPDFPNYRKKSGGDDQVFIEAVDPKWGGELPFSVLYARDGKKARTLSGGRSYSDFERDVAALLK
jgi:thiol-disulfide isomerase/thioredoxin